MKKESVFEQKQKIRDLIKKKRARLTWGWIERNSKKIADHLIELQELKIAKSIHCYVAWQNEVDTHEFIKKMLNQNRRVIVPKVDVPNHKLYHSQILEFSDLKPGAFGILEPELGKTKPVQISDIDLIIVPGIAFDLHGNRMGYGGGYYDDFLKNASATKIGFAFQFQIFDKIPTQAQDQRVDILISETTVRYIHE